MTDERFVFVEDLRTRKSAARGSAHMKRGSKSKKCSLPSDNLTAAQLRKMNGEVMEYKIGQPISWAEFKSYPVEMQKKYLEWIKNNFEMSRAPVAEMFGVHSTTLHNYIAENCPELKDFLVRRSTIENTVRFKEWLNKSVDETPPAEPVAPVEPVVVEKVVEVKKPEMPYFVNVLQNGSMELSGTATEIFQTLFGIFRDANLELSVNFRVVPQEPEPEEIEELEEDDGLVNMNTCTFRHLRNVGVEPNIAATVIKNRPYAAVEDLKSVEGISPIAYAFLEKRVKV